MRADDFDAFRELLGEVHDFYRQPVSSFVADVWWNAMRPYDLDTVRKALSRHVMNPDSGQFVPKPADVVKMLGGTTKDAALVAWSRVQKAIRDFGTWATVVFDDPVIHRTIEDLGGWTWLGDQSEDELPFVEKRFCDHYRAHKTRGLADYPPKLMGRIDTANLAAGYEAMAPTLIGDPRLCERVLRGPADDQVKKLKDRANERSAG